MLTIYRKKEGQIKEDSSCVEFRIEEGYIQISLTRENKLCIVKRGFNTEDQINIIPDCSNRIYIQ